MPVLTEKAIKGTGLIEDSQILVAILSALGVGKLRVTNASSVGTDPISHAVSRQGIIIPTDIALAYRGTLESAFPVGA